MHELLLYGQVPVERHEQSLKILAGIAAMQPQTLFERHVILRPLRANEDVKPNKKFPNKPVKPQSATFQQLIQHLDISDFGKEVPIKVDPENDAAQQSRPWKLKTQEIPEPETKTVVLRQANETALDEEQLRKHLDPANYGLVSEFVIEGHRFVHKNVVLTLSRILRLNDVPQSAFTSTLPTLESLKPLDPSGSFLLEACVRIDDRTKPKLVSSATDELNAFRESMRGSIEMKVPERLSLDTRVR